MEGRSEMIFIYDRYVIKQFKGGIHTLAGTIIVHDQTYRLANLKRRTATDLPPSPIQTALMSHHLVSAESPARIVLRSKCFLSQRSHC